MTKQYDDYGEETNNETIEALHPDNKLHSLTKSAQVILIKQAMMTVAPNHQEQTVDPDALANLQRELF